MKPTAKLKIMQATKYLYIKTFGCQMNSYDSQKMFDIMRANLGFEATDDLTQAHLLLLNTCSVREKAQEKLFSMLGQWQALKKQNPDLLIGVGGCVASQEGQAILKRAPYVDIVFGPQTLHRLPNLYQTAITEKRSVVDISFPEIEKFDNLPKPRAEGPTAFVSIMEGCSKYCSFCIVPYTRGEEISRPFDDVLAEVAELESQGVREINLLGQNVNDYRAPIGKNQTADLALLISYIATLEGIARIRYTTSHPLAFSDRLIQAYAEIPKLANHLHLPVQSGSDLILNRMKRGYTALEYKQKIKRLQQIRPNIRISSDFIIGFPGETEADFLQTMELIDWVKFDTSFSFIYSQRPGTPAASLPDDTPTEVKKDRLAKLQQRLRYYADGYSQQMVGQPYTVLVTGHSKKDPKQLSGRTECNRIVNFKGPETMIGHLVNVTFTEALTNSLRGVRPQVIDTI